MKKIHLLFGAIFASSLFVPACSCGDDTETGAGGGDATTGTTSSTTSSTTSTGTPGTGGSGGAGVGGTGGGGAPGTGGTDTTTGTGGSGGGPTTPPKPTLGAQIDRMGRPGVNTALNKTFTDDATRKAAQDAYNADADPAMWATKYTKDFAASLAILDSLDTNCGNQLLACDDTTDATCYDTLATVLVDDRLYLNTAGASCSVTAPAVGYLAVEANAVGVANTDCGGRVPAEDVIKRTYSVLANGSLGDIDDNITAPANDHPATFPYMAAPQ